MSLISHTNRTNGFERVTCSRNLMVNIIVEHSFLWHFTKELIELLEIRDRRSGKNLKSLYLEKQLVAWRNIMNNHWGGNLVTCQPSYKHVYKPIAGTRLSHMSIYIQILVFLCLLFSCPTILFNNFFSWFVSFTCMYVRWKIKIIYLFPISRNI